MKRKHIFISTACLSVLFGSELIAQQAANSAKLSGRAVRSPHPPGLSSARRSELNRQVNNGILKQNRPTKSQQSQITNIQNRLRLRLPPIIIGNAKGAACKLDKIWFPYGTNGTGAYYSDLFMIFYGWGNWLPR